MSPRTAKSFGDKAPGREQRIGHADKANWSKPSRRTDETNQTGEPDR